MSERPVEDSLWSVGHAEGRQVPVGEGEQDHEDDEGRVVTEDDGESGVFHVAQHDQRDEDQTRHHGGGEQKAAPRGLRRHPQSFNNTHRTRKLFEAGGGLTHWTRAGVLRPAKSVTLKMMKATHVKTLSVREEENTERHTFPYRKHCLDLLPQVSHPRWRRPCTRSVRGP